VLVLAASAALCACAREDEEVSTAYYARKKPKAPPRDLWRTAFAAVDVQREGGDVRGPKSDRAPVGGPGVETYAGEIDLAALTRVVLAVDVDDEGAINRALLGLGAGIPARSEIEAGRVAEALTRLAKNERASVRRGAIALLGRMPTGRVVGDPFAAALLDSDAEVRRHAVVGRTRLGVEFHWRQLTALAGDADAGVRQAVARGLASVDHEEARQTLGRLLVDRDDAVVAAASASLAASGAGAAMPTVLEAARSSRPNVRRGAAVVLSADSTPGSLARLVALTNDEAASVRKDAVWGLSGMDGAVAADARTATEAIAFDARRRGRAERFEALQGLARTETAPDLDALLSVAEKDRDVLLRVTAARTLALRGDARALPSLVRFLEIKPGAGVGDDDASFVRSTAERALCEVTGRTPASRTAEEWARALPDLERRVAKGRGGVGVARLAQIW
jgi:HEAT repeat protein